MYTILGFMIFPVMVSLFQSYNGWPGNGNPEPAFDTTLITGYTYFRTQGIVIDENSCIPFYNAVYSYLGTPHRSRAGGRGLDCSGLVKKVFAEAYDVSLKGSSRDLYRITNRVSESDLAEGDMIFFTIGSNQINHVGIYLNNGKFVHTSSTGGVTINELSEGYYARYYLGAGRVTF
jgi:lipoprotein Spr